MKRRLGASLAVSMACAACAGDEIPPLDWDLANAIAAAYGGGTGSPSTGNSGSGGSGSVGAVATSAAGAGGSSPELDATTGSSAGAVGTATLPDAGPLSPGGGSLASPPTSPCEGFAILQANCGTSGCHGEGSNLGAFAASKSAARGYIGKSGAVCAGLGPILNPADPPASILVQKLGDNPPCGQHMPLYGALLPEEDIACIEDWIGSLD